MIVPVAAKAAIIPSSKRTIAIVARYYLDVFRTRENIKADFEMLQKQLDVTVNSYRYQRGTNAIRFSNARGTHNPLRSPSAGFPVDNSPSVG